MNGRFERYLQEQLGTTGFAILDHELAWKLRPDVFGTASNCGSAFTESRPEIDRYLRQASVGLYAVKLELAAERFFVAARSPDQLAERLKWLVGRKVVEIIPAASVRQPAAEIRSVRSDGPEVPAWPCNTRSEMLAERGETDDKFKKPATRGSLVS